MTLSAGTAAATAALTTELDAPPHEERSSLELLVNLDRPAQPSAEPRLEYGTVASASPELTVALSANASARVARRAKSCLVAAEAGDRVLCSVDGETVFILAVLEGATDTKLVAEGNLSLHAAGTLSLASDALELRAKSGLVAIEELRAFGRELDATFGGKVGLFAEKLETRVTTLLQRAKQAYRFVEGLDQTRAGVFDVRAESLAAIRGETTIMAARVLAKLDGEQVKIG